MIPLTNPELRLAEHLGCASVPDDLHCLQCSDPVGRGCREEITVDRDENGRVTAWGAFCEECSRLLAERDRREAGLAAPTYEDYLQASGLPSGLWGYTWDDVHFPEAIKDDLRSAVVTIKDATIRTAQVPSVLIHGSVGAGKSGFCACWLMDWMRMGRPGRWCDWHQWIREVSKEEYSTAEAEITKLVRYRGMLVVDDMVPQQVTPYQADVMFRLVNVRLDSKLVTVWTTQYQVHGDDSITVESQYGSRTASRLSKGTVLHWRGPDRRRV